MAAGSKVSLVIDSGRVELLPEAVDYSREGFLPGGLKRNIEFIAGCVEFADSIPEEIRNVLFDPQTSSGLLFSVAAADAPGMTAALREGGISAQEIGHVVEKTKPTIRVR